MNFLNSDYVVTPGTLHAAKITIPELQKRMFERVQSLNSTWFESDVYENLPNVDAIKQDEGLITAVKVLMFDDSIITGDNVYELGSNDIAIPGYDEYSNLAHDMYYHGGKFGEMLFGWQTLPNGLTFLGCSMAEGGLCDAFAIIYFDGQNLRLYTPVRGNRINTIYGTVLGSEYYDETMAAILETKSGVKNNGVDVGNIYANMYVPGAGVSDAPMHWDAMRDEIMQAITVDDAQPAQIPQKPAKSFAQNRAEQRALAKNAVIQDWLNLSDSNPNAAVSIRCDQGPIYCSATTFTRKSGVITVDGEYAPHFTVYINAYKHLPDFLKRLADTMQDIFDVFEVLPMETAPAETNNVRFINDDQKVKAGGREAARIAIGDLQRMIHERAILVTSSRYYLDNIGQLADVQAGGMALHCAIEVLHHNDTIIRRDNVYNVGCDTICVPGFQEYRDETNGKFGEHLCGWHTLPNGLSFFGYISSEDGMVDAFNIIYFDGKNLRLYTPVRGNLINMDYKCAFGAEGEIDEDVEERLMRKYREAGIDVEKYEDIDEFWLVYPALYGFTDVPPYHWNAIREDIETHIAVI